MQTMIDVKVLINCLFFIDEDSDVTAYRDTSDSNDDSVTDESRFTINDLD